MPSDAKPNDEDTRSPYQRIYEDVMVRVGKHTTNRSDSELRTYAVRLVKGRVTLTGQAFSEADARKLMQFVEYELQKPTHVVLTFPEGYPGSRWVDEGAERESIILGALYDMLGYVSTRKVEELVTQPEPGYEYTEASTGHHVDAPVAAFDGAKFVEMMTAWWKERTGGELRSLGTEPYIKDWHERMHVPQEKRATSGMYGKFVVMRVDGRDNVGQKHERCQYFVLDLTHDQYARDCAREYSFRCQDAYPQLARDLASTIKACEDHAERERQNSAQLAVGGAKMEDPYAER